MMDKEYQRKVRFVEVAPRRMYIEKDDLQEHGYTVGCPGCKSLLMGDRMWRNHNDGCKRRMEEARKRIKGGGRG